MNTAEPHHTAIVYNTPTIAPPYAAATITPTSSSSTNAINDESLQRWLSLLNDTDAARFYNDTRPYWPPPTEDLHAGTLRHDALETGLLCVAYVIVFVAGVLGNVLVIWIVMRTPQLRTTTNLFIVSLAAADLMVNCLCVPFTLVANLFKVWSMGKAVCKVVGFLQGVSVTASVGTLMAIAVERCSVIHSTVIGGWSRSKCRHCIVTLWLLAMAVNVPSLFVFTLQPFPSHSRLDMCVERWPSRHLERAYFIVVNVLLGYLGPLIVITGCYASIWRKAANRRLPGEQMTHLQQQARMRLKATRMVLVFVVTFAVTWLPLYMIFCVAKFGEHILGIRWVQNAFYIMLPIAQWLGAANSSVNPLLYAYLNRRFRKHFLNTARNWLHCCRGTIEDQRRRQTDKKRPTESKLSSRRLMKHSSESAGSTKSTEPMKTTSPPNPNQQHQSNETKPSLITIC